MSVIEVLLAIPEHIETGLATGVYERIGGVIRHADSKQVVMWLQEGGRAVSNPDPTSGVLASVMRSTGMSPNAMSVMFGGSLMTLNVAISGYSLYLMVDRIQELEQQIEAIHERVSEEFARDRRIEFEAAIANARDVVDAENENYKQQAAKQAIDQLFKARQQRLTDFQTISGESTAVDALQQAQAYLLQAMMADTMRARCYLETNQTRLARARLTEALEEYYDYTEQLIRGWLGKYPARYFHIEVAEEDFVRFLNIEAWLRGKDDVLYDVVMDYRKDFWNRDTIKTTAWTSLTNINIPFLNRSEEAQEPLHATMLTQVELLIENFQRLRGFELELATMRLRFEEWDTYVPDLENHDDYVLLVDTELLDATSRLAS